MIRLLLGLILFSQFALNPSSASANQKNRGKLFIIGGGSRPDMMINRLIDEADLRNKGYVFILPMASESGDSAIIWSGEQFVKKGIKNVTGYNFEKEVTPEKKWIDSLENAALIYISGGDQARFMNTVSGTPIVDAIHKAYKNGAVIAGTSAGAAVMSQNMITGNALLHPTYYETFKTIEYNNIEFAPGLGLIKNVIIDQHFLIRSRHNRLITSVLEKPEIPGIGIDESTALLVKENQAEVVGNSQVLVYRNRGKKTSSSDTKAGGKNILLDIYIPGDKFKISK